jgi:predicted PurR-regulated permease PerM
MNAVITAVIILLGQIAPLVQTGSNVAKIIQALIELLPTIVQVAQDLQQPVKNIISALQNNAATSDELMKQLKDLDAQVDTAFEKEAARVEAEDK